MRNHVAALLVLVASATLAGCNQAQDVPPSLETILDGSWLGSVLQTDGNIEGVWGLTVKNGVGAVVANAKLYAWKRDTVPEYLAERFAEYPDVPLPGFDLEPELTVFILEDHEPGTFHVRDTAWSLGATCEGGLVRNAMGGDRLFLAVGPLSIIGVTSMTGRDSFTIGDLGMSFMGYEIESPQPGLMYGECNDGDCEVFTSSLHAAAERLDLPLPEYESFVGQFGVQALLETFPGLTL